MHIASGQGHTGHPPPPQRTKSWCHFGHLLLVSITDDNSFWIIHCFTFFPYKSIRDRIWPCSKIGQGQPRVIIWTNLVVLEYSVSRSSASWFQRRWFLRLLPYMGMAAILDMWPGPFEQTFVPHPIEIPYEIWHQSAHWFLRRCLKSVDDWQTDGRRRVTYPISSPMSLRLRWAKIYIQELWFFALWASSNVG